ncbi:HlyD family type I secretion periplasmic adaptor subunit [Aquabacterium sp.]|uniref:HlyD family type I secretion periplasmic adaptor subunit n=1 Tax=Aquabacterium sp. TaxID=1872578 RepID=UPI0025C409D3|nr:HlyD family type I secretion periplasmic adaptor subunit [Aquabacterium sp.]
MDAALNHKTWTLLAQHFDSGLGAQRVLKRPRWLVYTGALVTVGLVTWLAFARVDMVVRTTGRVVPSGRQQLVQHLEGGIVAKVFVREGDVVGKGQSLMAVSDLQANSSRGEKQARLDGLKARVARLQAEAEGNTRLVMPAELAGEGTEMRNQSDAFSARQAKLQQSLRVIEEQIAQKRQEANEQEARRKGLSSELEVARQQLALVTAMLAKNAASQLELLDARARVERLTTQIREAESAAPRLRAAAEELQARLAESRALFRSEASTLLADARVELQRVQQEIGADNDRVRRTVVQAPVAGTVNKLLFNTVGGVVKPGDTLMELTPSDDVTVLDTRVSPSERGALQVGQTAHVKVAAFDYTVYGTLSGRVSEISADSLIDERGERYFRVGITVDPASVKAFGQMLTPGMTVSADAVTGQRTVLQYLLSPVRALSANAFRDRK